MSVVASGGQLVAVGVGQDVRVGRGVALTGGEVSTYEEIWRSQPQVRTVVSFLARNIAQLGLHVFRRVSDTDRVRLTSPHPVAATISRPNPDTTRYELIEALVSDLAIYDNAYWLKVRWNGGIALLRLPPPRTTPAGDNWLLPERYEVTGTKGKVVYSAEQVIHFRGWNPADARVGLSPLETLRRILAEEAAAAEYREQLWRNGARSSGYLTRPADAPDWSPETRSRFLTEFRDLYSGNGAQAGGVPLLEDGMKLEPGGFSAEQAQYIQARKLTREEVTSAYHVPPPMVGILEHATFSNITEQHKQLYQDTLGPTLTSITERLALRLLPDYGADAADVYLEFNLAEKLKGSFEEQATQLQTAVGAPWLTRNEARARQNLPMIEGGDALVVPLNVLTGGQASPTDSAPPPKALGPGRRALPGPDRKAGVGGPPEERWSEKYAEVLGRFFERQRKAVVSELGAAKARGKADVGDIFDQQRWDAELATDLYPVNLAAALAAARQVLAALDLDEDEVGEERVAAWLARNAELVAQGVNNATARALEAALDEDDALGEVGHLFDLAVSVRALQIGQTQGTAMHGFGGREGASAAGLTRKTWNVRSSRPRATHARLDGVSVPLDEKFPNGALWPGDPSLDGDERAGCSCDLTYDREDDD